MVYDGVWSKWWFSRGKSDLAMSVSSCYSGVNINLSSDWSVQLNSLLLLVRVVRSASLNFMTIEKAGLCLPRTEVVCKQFTTTKWFMISRQVAGTSYYHKVIKWSHYENYYDWGIWVFINVSSFYPLLHIKFNQVKGELARRNSFHDILCSCSTYDMKIYDFVSCI